MSPTDATEAAYATLHRIGRELTAAGPETDLERLQELREELREAVADVQSLRRPRYEPDLGPAAHPRMGTADVATFLNVSTHQVRELALAGRLPWVDLGKGEVARYGFDPTDIVVFYMASKAGVSPEAFREMHGPEGVRERCRQYVEGIRRVMAGE